MIKKVKFFFPKEHYKKIINRGSDRQVKQELLEFFYTQDHFFLIHIIRRQPNSFGLGDGRNPNMPSNRFRVRLLDVLSCN